MVRLTEWESINGQMANFMMENGREVISMGMAFGGELTEIHMSASGWTLKLRGTVFTSGQLVISMKESGKTVLRKERGQNPLQMEMSLLVTTKMVVRAGKANINGQMAQHMLEIFLTV